MKVALNPAWFRLVKLNLLDRREPLYAFVSELFQVETLLVVKCNEIRRFEVVDLSIKIPDAIIIDTVLFPTKIRMRELLVARKSSDLEVSKVTCRLHTVKLNICLLPVNAVKLSLRLSPHQL